MNESTPDEIMDEIVRVSRDTEATQPGFIGGLIGVLRHAINLDPHPASVEEVADEIARVVLNLDASGAAPKLLERLSVRLVTERQKRYGY